jgi:hypothetical protein
MMTYNAISALIMPAIHDAFSNFDRSIFYFLYPKLTTKIRRGGKSLK